MTTMKHSSTVSTHNAIAARAFRGAQRVGGSGVSPDYCRQAVHGPKSHREREPAGRVTNNAAIFSSERSFCRSQRPSLNDQASCSFA